jgi:hypothetical protein
VHVVEGAGQVVLRRQLKRRQVLAFFRSCRHAWLVSRRVRHRTIGPASCRRWGIRCG